MSAIIRPLALLVLAGTLLGCVESNQEVAAGKASVRGVNALVDAFDVNFRIEEFGLGVIGYKAVTSSARYDDLTYTFNFDISIAGQGTTQRIASVTQRLMADNDYVIVLAGSIATPEIFVWERAERIWTDTEEVFEMGFGHASPSLGPVDVYFAPKGTVPVQGTAIGSLAYGERIAELEFVPDTYELTLTAVGDVTIVRYQGDSTINAVAATITSVIYDGDPSITGPFSVRQFVPGGANFELGDSRFPPTVQIIHAAVGFGNIDLVVDDDYLNPTISNLGFGVVSADAEVPTGVLTYAYTPPNSSVPWLEQDLAIALGSRTSVILHGEPGAMAATNLISRRRPFSAEAQFRISHAAFNFPTVDVYLSDTGAAPEDSTPTFTAFPYPLVSEFQRVAANSYELTVTNENETTVIAGPLTLDLNNGDVVEIVIMDTVDPAVGQLFEFTNLTP